MAWVGRLATLVITTSVGWTTSAVADCASYVRAATDTTPLAAVPPTRVTDGGGSAVVVLPTAMDELHRFRAYLIAPAKGVAAVDVTSVGRIEDGRRLILDLSSGNAGRIVANALFERYELVIAGWERQPLTPPDALSRTRLAIVQPGLGYRVAGFVGIALIIGFALALARTRLVHGPSGRPSLTNVQICWFTGVVLVLVTHGLVSTGTLASLSSDVLLLMGIGAVSAVGAKVTDQITSRLSWANCTWLQQQDWVRAAQAQATRPCLLCDQSGQLDIFRLQAAAFSVIVGASLFLQGVDALGSFTLPSEFLAVLGLSQITYIGGKIARPPAFKEFDAQLTQYRDEGEPGGDALDRL